MLIKTFRTHCIANKSLLWLSKYLGLNEFLPNSKIIKYIAEIGCDSNTEAMNLCEEIIFLFCGFDKKEFNKDILLSVLNHEPAGTSTKTVVHYAQEIKSGGRFCQFDYGTDANMKRYGTKIPPSYNVTNMYVPIYLMSALNDWLAGPQAPSTAAEWLTISREFEERWNLPNVVAAMDGKHIIFQAPRSAGSLYYNYKGTHSIILLALVDADYNFLYIDVGTNGRISDGGVYRQSSLSTAIEQNTINLLEDKALPGRKKLIPYVIVADAAFPLSTNIMKPFPFRDMTQQQVTFNYRLSRARNVVENAFGILSNRFRILLTKINLSPNKVQCITLACCTLHNYLKKENASNYITANPENEVNMKYTFQYALSQQKGNRPRTAAIEIRQEFLEYVNGVGRLIGTNN